MNEAKRIAQRLREQCMVLRYRPIPLNHMIPLMQEAADALDAAVPAVQPGDVLVRLHRPEGYEDVHPELILQDANINPAFEPEVAAVPAHLVQQLQEPVAVDATEQRRALLVGECDWSEVAREPAAGVTAAHPLHMPTDEQFRFMRVPQHENYACEKAAIRLFCRLNGITRRLNAQCTAASAECAATQRHITDMLVAHRDMIEAQQRGDSAAEVLAVRRMEAARSAVAGASPCRPRQTDTGEEQLDPFWCHEQSHDRARCESQCAECAEDGPAHDLEQQPQVRALMARAYEEGADAMERAAIEAVHEHLSGETLAQREEVCAAWHALPDDLRQDQRLARLYHALGGPCMEEPAEAAPSHAPSGLAQQLATAVEAIEATHDPLCMAVLRGKACTCGVTVRNTPSVVKGPDHG